MNKIIIEILLSLTIPATIFQNQVYNFLVADKPVNKQVSLSINGDSNYTQKAYDMSTATVRVFIFKVSEKKQTILWSRVYGSMPLKNFPLKNGSLNETVTLHNISDRKEKLYVTYMITYNSKGSVMELENGTTLAKGVKQDKVEIKI